ncbi:hypothetical protein DH2020_048678 [Rehmannia glutinosa]|uniref:Carbohydrate kinase PfkB domain-containing protein n=1 Tax=Rehmannia glutinosa TaxID=99300 RepID=A0ABR0U4Y9_REHGL
MLIDFVPTVGGVSLAEAPAFKKAPGGAPANVAVCIAKLGGSSALSGRCISFVSHCLFKFAAIQVGKDEFGFMLADSLKENKVDNSGLRFDPYARTALAFVTLREDGEREFMFYRHPSADMLLQESELDVNLVKKATIFHYGSISLIEEPCRSTQIAAMGIAKKSGSLLSYDPNLRLPLWPSDDAARKEIMAVWDKADIIKISEDEISFLTKGDDPYDDSVVLKKLFHPNLRLLLVSEGKAGCRYYTKSKTISLLSRESSSALQYAAALQCTTLQFKGRVSGVKVKSVDTNGAGDAFTGAILYCLASDVNLLKDEKRLRDALFFANACGALTVTKNGAIPALPTKEEVQQIMRQVSA